MKSPRSVPASSGRILRGLLSALVILLTPPVISAGETVVDSFDQTIRPILETHCLRCHGGEKKSGGIDFSGIQNQQSILRSRKIWRKSLAQVETLEMPPAKARVLENGDRQRLIGWLRDAIALQPSQGADDPGPSLIRRLSLSEYNNTIRDLLGVEFDASIEVGMAEEGGEANPYGNLAASLEIPPALLEKYFDAADKILDRLLATELRSSTAWEVQERSQAARERLFLLPPNGWRTGTETIRPPSGMNEQEAARKILGSLLRRAYRRPVQPEEIESIFKIYQRGVSKGLGYVASLRLGIKAILVSPHFLFRIESDRPDQGNRIYPINDHELASRLSYFVWSSMPDRRLLELADQGKLTGTKGSTAPTVLAGRVIGSPTRFNNRYRDKAMILDDDPGTFFEGEDPNTSWVGLDLHVPRLLTEIRFSPAHRQADRMKGGKFQGSSSADFTTGVEDLVVLADKPSEGPNKKPLPEGKRFRYVRYWTPAGQHAVIGDLEIWGVSEGSVLEQEVRRMLDHPRALALTDDFAARWLQIKKLPTARPSTEFFPDFQPDIRKAMYDETALFFDRLRQDDGSLLDLLDANYTYLNESLAAYYKIPGVQGKEMRRVELKPEFHRGGLLGMGSILALTSHTSRTSPTLRGKWILEVLLGAPPPPPPPDAGMFKEEEKGKEPTSFREKLTQHAVRASCASCHKKLDPLGFALENYDAVGLWRKDDRGKPLDTTGVLPTGEKISGAADLKQIITQRKDQFLRNLTEQLFLYALGRELDWYDDLTLNSVHEGVVKDQGRFSRLILGIVQSAPFQNRRNAQVER